MPGWEDVFLSFADTYSHFIHNLRRGRGSLLIQWWLCGSWHLGTRGARRISWNFWMGGLSLIGDVVVWLDDEWDLQLFTHDFCGFMSSTLKAVSTCLFAECPWVFVLRVLLLVLVLFKQASREVLLLLYALKIKYPSADPWRNNQLRTFDQRFPTSAHYSPSLVTWAQGVSESWQSWRPITKSIVTWHSPASFSNPEKWLDIAVDSLRKTPWGTGVKSLVDASQYNTEYTNYTMCTVYLCVPKNSRISRRLKHYWIFRFMKYIVTIYIYIHASIIY